MLSDTTQKKKKFAVTRADVWSSHSKGFKHFFSVPLGLSHSTVPSKSRHYIFRWRPLLPSFMDPIHYSKSEENTELMSLLCDEMCFLTINIKFMLMLLM